MTWYAAVAAGTGTVLLIEQPTKNTMKTFTGFVNHSIATRYIFEFGINGR